MVITITSNKGGVGKTMSAIHLAAALHSDVFKVVVLDKDDNRSAVNWYKTGLNTPHQLPFQVVSDAQFAKIASQYNPDETFVIIDSQARPRPEILEEIVTESHLVIIPTFTEHQSLRTLPPLIAQIEDIVAKNRGESAKYRLLITNVPPEPQKDGRRTRDLLTEYGSPIFDSMIRSYKCFRTATEFGTSVNRIRDERAAAGWSDYMSLAAEVRQLFPHTQLPQPAAQSVA